MAQQDPAQSSQSEQLQVKRTPTTDSTELVREFSVNIKGASSGGFLIDASCYGQQVSSEETKQTLWALYNLFK